MASASHEIPPYPLPPFFSFAPFAKRTEWKPMNQNHFDTLVLGGGAMGSATALQLARRGQKVGVLEQFSIGHELGSSNGYSRIIRRAYYEHPDYVPLVDRAYALWRELEKESGESLLTITGIVEMGSPAGPLVKGSLLSCEQHEIPHERLSAEAIRERHPQFTIPEWMEGVWQGDAGILAVERCVVTQARMARQHGATIIENAPVLGIQCEAEEGVVLETPRGSYSADNLVVCAGAWAGKLLADLNLPLVVTRQAQGFYKPKDPRAFELGTFPVWLAELPGHSYYGFPMFGVRAIKIAHHGGGDLAQADSLDRNFRADDDRLLRDFMKEYLPAANGELMFGKICMYTNTPDHDFIVDAHPVLPRVWMAAGFSGHGFKFAPAIGEALADLVIDGQTKLPIGRFSLGRLGYVAGD